MQTITDTFKRLNKNMHGDDPGYYRLPEERNLAAQYLLLYEMSLPYGLDLNNQIDIDKAATKIAVTMQTLSSNEVITFDNAAHAWLAENTPSIEPYASSPTLMFAHLGKRNINSMLTGTLKTRRMEATEIEDAVMQGDRLTFTVKPKAGRGMTFEFDAKAKRESLDGTVYLSFESLGRGQEFPWNAERE